MKDKLKQDLKESMLAKNELKTSVLRLLISALSYMEIQKGGAGYEATDEDVISTIQKEVKQRKDSIEQYTNAGRMELVEKEEKELEILSKYLPEQMGEEEITAIVKEAISQTGASSIQDMGKVMGVIMPKTKGKADGSLVSQIVRKELTS
jgi:uncharacterized protein